MGWGAGGGVKTTAPLWQNFKHKPYLWEKRRGHVRAWCYNGGLRGWWRSRKAGGWVDPWAASMGPLLPELLSYHKVRLLTGGWRVHWRLLHFKNTDNDPNLIQHIIFQTEKEVIVNTTPARLQTNDIWELKTQTEAVGVFSWALHMKDVPGCSSSTKWKKVITRCLK